MGNSNAEKLQKAKIIDMDNLNQEQIDAINSLTTEEVEQSIAIAEKLKSKLDKKDQEMSFAPF